MRINDDCVYLFIPYPLFLPSLTRDASKLNASIMKSISLRFTLLPSGTAFGLRVRRATRRVVSRALSSALALTSSTPVYLRYCATARRFVTVAGDTVPDGCHVLLRCAAGGKGGYRKQLEKKGREFARAKRKMMSSSREGAATSSTRPAPHGGVPITSAAALTKKYSTAESKASTEYDDSAGNLIVQLVNQGLQRVMDEILKGDPDACTNSADQAP